MMRAIEDIGERLPNMEDRLRALRYTHEVLIRALDQEEDWP